ncbi:hypothetical protein D9611_009685 [Ephemerocybe angulata]|uniref:Enoyl reductase (ER) domain-containing protein n=1 Tax=Ephemerocybe angulata TaxID=980116 RepID=A0A8H5FFZ4_9AGAR|nr:hypothetical protein D9611_009685 [Tulosesus angulatus]
MANIQKALVVPAKGTDFVVDAAFPIPVPGNDQLLVKTKAVALNPVDYFMQKTGMFVETYPAVLGLDIAGEVVKVGEGEVASKFKAGDRVIFPGGLGISEKNGFQQYAVADAKFSAIVPPNVSYDEAATIPLGLFTAYYGLYEAVPKGLGLTSFAGPDGVQAYTGQAIFIPGGSSSVGTGAIQLAKLSGFKFIITTASLKHTDFLKSIGATHVLDRSITVDELRAALKEIEGLPEIKYAYDAIGDLDTSFRLALEAVVPKGNVVTVNPRLVYDSPDKDGKVTSKFMTERSSPSGEAHMRNLWGDLTRLLETGALKGSRPEILPGGLAGIPAGLDRLAKQEVSGVKLVARPEETL